MNVLDKRTKYNDQINENLFIRTTLKDVASSIRKKQTTLMQSRGFKTANFFSGRAFSVPGNVMHYDHLAKHRFVDMKTLSGRWGIKRKRSHPLHNRMLYGHANSLIKTLSFGYVQAAKEQMQALQDRMRALGYK